MALYPDTQQRLYTEITKVIGQNRLPEFDEIKDIPYLHAVVRETLRWQPVVPLGTCTIIEFTVHSLRDEFYLYPRIRRSPQQPKRRRIPGLSRTKRLYYHGEYLVSDLIHHSQTSFA